MCDLDHNALGNNLNASVDDVVHFLASKTEADDVRRDVTDYLMKLYLVVERVYEVLDIMGLIGVHHPKDGRLPFEFRKSTPGMCAMRDVKQLSLIHI